MKTEITRDVILDLLPLYLSDEVSADTRTLVEKYLESDPELLEIAEKSAKMELPEDIPIPIKKEDQMEAYKEAQRLILRRTAIWAGLLAVGLLSFLGLALLAFFMLTSVM